MEQSLDLVEQEGEGWVDRWTGRSSQGGICRAFVQLNCEFREQEGNGVRVGAQAELERESRAGDPRQCCRSRGKTSWEERRKNMSSSGAAPELCPASCHHLGTGRWLCRTFQHFWTGVF